MNSGVACAYNIGSITRPCGLSNALFNTPICLTRVPDYLYNERMQPANESSAKQEVLSYLYRAASRNALAHAHALIGPLGSGQMELAEDFLRDFIPAPTLAHPDVRILEPEAGVI